MACASGALDSRNRFHVHSAGRRAATASLLPRRPDPHPLADLLFPLRSPPFLCFPFLQLGRFVVPFPSIPFSAASPQVHSLSPLDSSIPVHRRCKRFRELGQTKVVLAKVSPRCLAVRAKSWSDSAHRFLQSCADAGNLDASYVLGMIRFYCLGSRGSGAALMAAAAVGGHREALYSLAVIQFHGSGGTKDDRDLRAGAVLCARAASLGHVDALRELGHCLQDGYGVRRSLLDGRRLLIQANARELAAAVTASASVLHAAGAGAGSKVSRRHSCLLSDFGCRAAAAGEAHAANRFLAVWFESRPLGADSGPVPAEEDGTGGGLRLCSHALCGRPETRRHEFRRCSVCGVVNYYSRVCQALHWKMSHKAECAPMDRWLDAGNANPDPNAVAAPAL